MSDETVAVNAAPLNIGLTYDLRSEYLAAGYGEEETAEFDSEITIDGIEDALRQLGHQTDRIGNARRLTSRLAAGDRWDLVFNICEGLHGLAREAQVPAMLDVFEIPYTFSDPLLMALCLHKGMTKTIVRDAGVPTPRFAVVQRLADLRTLNLEYPLFAKPIAEGTGKGVDGASVIRDPDQLTSVCERLLSRFRQPVLVEEFLPGREFTVAILGTADEAEPVGTMEIVLLDTAEPGSYSYINKEEFKQRVVYPRVTARDDAVVREAEAVALKAWRSLGCRDAGRIDLRCNAKGQPQFIEVNPVAGLHPIHSDLPFICYNEEYTYVEIIDRIVRSAARRVVTSSAESRKVSVGETNSVQH